MNETTDNMMAAPQTNNALADLLLAHPGDFIKVRGTLFQLEISKHDGVNTTAITPDTVVFLSAPCEPGERNYPWMHVRKPGKTCAVHSVTDLAAMFTSGQYEIS